MKKRYLLVSVSLLLISGLILIFNPIPKTKKTTGKPWLSPLDEPINEKAYSIFHQIHVLTSPDGEHAAWKVVVGRYPREQLVEILEKIENECAQAEDEKLSCLVQDPGFPLSPWPIEYEVFIMDSWELGLPTVSVKRQEIPHDLIKAKIEAAGYELCTPEVAVMVILGFSHYTDPIYVAADGIVGILTVQNLKPVIFWDNSGNVCDVVRRISQSYNAPRVFIVMKRRPIPPYRW